MVSVAPQNRLDTLPEGVPKLTLGWEALAWAGKYLHHPNGIRQGKPWKFTPNQARFILWFYSINEFGAWNYAEAHRRLAKGSGKSPFAATAALIDFLAPVRLDHFDPTIIGGCIGKPVQMPWVQIAAVSEKQTENTMRMVRAMVAKKRNPQLHKDYELDPGKTQINLVPEGKLEVITSSATTQEGAEVTLVIGDELEHWTPSNGGVELYDTLLDNLTKSGNRLLGTLNAWKPGVGTVGETVFDAWVDQELGKTKAERKILMDARKAPPDTTLADPVSLRRGLEFVYADCPWADIDAIMSRIWTPSSKPDDAKRKYLNWPTTSYDAWVQPTDLEQMARPDIRVEQGERIAMFFDGSLSRDSTALVGCRVSDGHVFLIGAWEPGNSHDGTAEKVDVDAVDRKVRWAKGYYNVAAYFADVREWESFTKVEWPRLFRGSLALWAVPSGANAEPVAWDMRSKLFDFTRACELVEREISEHSFTYDGSAVLTTHITNARRAVNRYGTSIRKESPNSAKKIDGAVCLIGARMVRRKLLEAEFDSNQYDGEAVFV
ncbi:phage terminase-like protein, large subunit [Corynebacterium mustelae]|uniref:Phage terminase-like protein, large subunit n=1 Tax=Corynebacterium mustelae TaxID=571915 RepID=A0A0G3GVL8_9CORY|nr:phage terminase-like protein, large subunit [Corynebacterium mustelae]